MNSSAGHEVGKLADEGDDQMDITTEYRSHWVAADGTRHASRYTGTGTGARILGMQPVINLDELREYVALAKKHLPACSSTPDGTPVSAWYAQQVINHPKDAHRHTISEVCGELTDSIPFYHREWRAPFVAMRERYKAVP